MPGERFVVGVTDNIPDETFASGESCLDIKGRTISNGHQYVPGPDSCTVCRCDGGQPKWCQAVLCAAPKGCNSFRIGNSCCEFICLDNAHGVHGEGSVDISWGEEHWVTGDLGVRLVASSVTAILSLALLAFLFYRLRRRRLRRLAALELESAVGGGTGSMASLGGIHGDLTSSMGHLSRQLPSVAPDGETPSPIYLMWKQPSSVPDVPPNTKSSNNVHLRSNDQDGDYHERVGLLALPTAPVITDQLHCSSDTLNSDALGRGTPPPSYAEVLASISVSQVNQPFTEENGPISNDGCTIPPEQPEEVHENPSSQVQQQQQQQWRLSLPLPKDRVHDSEAAIQRFSLQLALDWSDSNSSSSSSLSQVHPISSSSSSSATSLGPSNLT